LIFAMIPVSARHGRGGKQKMARIISCLRRIIKIILRHYLSIPLNDTPN
jgi:hypothetical protein